MIHIENKIPFACTAPTSAAATPVCSFCSKPGHYIHNCNDILTEDLTTQKSKRREKLLKQITLANDINDMMMCSKNLKLR